MKKIYLFVSLFTIQFVFSQNSQLYYSGRFFNEKNKPQNFLKIFNKNSGVYEMTDEKGYAIIAAKNYDTLVWNKGKNIQVVYRVQELKTILENQVEKRYVENIYTKDYDSLIVKINADNFSITKSEDSLTKNSDRYFPAVRKLKFKNDSLYKIKRLQNTSLIFNGNFSSSVDIKNRNRVPKTQNRYVQGRSQNGTLIWRGPETHELFSFGPDISTLGFYGQPYEYDLNGRLTDISNANSPAKSYNNNLFKTTVGYSNQLNLDAIIKKDGSYNEKARLTFNLGQQKDQFYFIDQFDIVNSFKAKFSTEILKFKINAGFNYEENKATNTNRIGLFNRAFKNSLLTPVSFSNMQNIYLDNGLQRRYSRFADNPEFLLEQKDKYNFYSNIRQFAFDVSRNWNRFRLNINQTHDNQDFMHRDVYKISTYGFENGLYNIRTQKNELYNSNILGSYEMKDNDLKSKFSLNYILNHRKVNLNHSSDRNYLYQRTSQDYIFNYNLDYDNYNDFEFGVNLGNSFYISNTSLENNYWLPKINGYFTFDRLFNWYGTDLQFIGAYTQLSYEPEITKSYSSYATTQFSAQNAQLYFPLKEAESFNNLSNINVKEWKTGFKLIINNKINLAGEYFSRKVINDIFPVFEGQNLVLKNLADHTYRGFEVNLSWDRIVYDQNFSFGSKASFFKYRDIVDRVNSGYNNLMISGFNDIYKTLSEGEVLGAVTGSYFEKSADGKIIVDDSGYPIKASGMKIIADPTPDFALKFTHNFTYKMFALAINWEWKKGGQIWNGTQAVLDYYGRSQTSADGRNIKNYVFDGVNYSGNNNQISVDFYNPDQSVNENRWTRYGFLGVAESYVQKADYIRINDISLSAYFDVGNFRKALGVSFYVNNIFLWQANSGVDSNQNFYDLDNSRGLDFFNLPSFKTFGCTVSFKF